MPYQILPYAGIVSAGAAYNRLFAGAVFVQQFRVLAAGFAVQLHHPAALNTPDQYGFQVGGLFCDVSHVIQIFFREIQSFSVAPPGKPAVPSHPGQGGNAHGNGEKQNTGRRRPWASR